MEILLPRTIGDFGKREYWERFFQSRQNTFEWYGDFLQHGDFFTKYVRKTDRTLVVGCGNSDLGLMLFDKLNVSDVTNIDISETIVNQMRQKHCSSNSKTGLHYECMDIFTLNDNIKSERIKPFSCILDKGTLDAIHSGENSDSDAISMFRNIDSALNLMGRYITVTLAQEHIVRSICNYFLYGTNQWLVNCHQLTSNKTNSAVSQMEDTFPLPVYGFVMTKLRPSDGLPRVSLFSLTSDEPIHLNGSPESLSQKLQEWISQEQNWSLLRHDVDCGKQHELYFSCPRTGMTVFRGVLVRMEQQTKKNKKASKRAPIGKIEAIFLVPFGQNNNPAFRDSTRRQELRKMIDVNTLLLMFTNPRCFHTDLEEIKSKLSAVLNALDRDAAETKKTPVLSTPDGYNRSETKLPKTKSKRLQILLDHVHFRQSDLDELLTLRRLVVPSADLRPIIATNVSSLSVPSLIAPRDLHVLTWMEILSTTAVCSHLAYYGLPSIGPLRSGRTKHARIYVIGTEPDEDVQIREVFCALHDNEFDTMRCCVCDKPLITWSSALCQEQEDRQFDLVLYDPIPSHAREYYSCFNTDRIDELSDTCAKQLSSQGWLVIVFEESAYSTIPTVSRPITVGQFTRVLSYKVSDSMFADPGTYIDIFHHNSMDSLDARAELLARLRNHRTVSEQQEDPPKQYTEMWDQLDQLLGK